MATLVKCSNCGVMTYAQPPGDGCHSCNNGIMEAQAQAPDYRGASPAVETLPDPDVLIHEPTEDTATAIIGPAGHDDPILDRRPNKGPKVTGKDGADLFHLLADGKFHKAKDIDMESRKIRAICAVYPNQFLSTQAGYKRVRDANEGEIENAVADLKSRIYHLARRVKALESVLVGRVQADMINDGT